MNHITLRLLGPFAVTRNGAALAEFDYAKVRGLLAYLAVEARPHSRTDLAALLWPDSPEPKARASLSQALLLLRTALGERTAARPLVRADAYSVQLDPHGAIEVDVTQFLAVLRVSDVHPHRSWRTCRLCSERLRTALGLYGGPFLGDVSIPDSAAFEEWSSLLRGYLAQHVQSALAHLVERAEWRGAYAEALHYGQRLVALEPLNEANQRNAMRLLALNGETAAALSQYKQLKNMLEQELAVEPEEGTTAVWEQIRRGAIADLQPSRPTSVVPRPPTPLVGRSQEAEAICARLQDINERMLVIIGPGGIGKTRLALEAAHALSYDYEDGVYVVELAVLNDASLVLGAVAEALSVTERPQQRLGETLRQYLRTKHLLLVLDNFEHVVAATPLVLELLAACPALALLVTSRTPLPIGSERQLSLEPLADAHAVQLFVERAHAVGADLAVDEVGTAVYTAICRRLDRLPLAIELAAARSRFFSPAELLERLNSRLAVLTGGARDLPLRQQTLRNTIDWSYNLLDVSEQTLFARLAVFAGGSSPAAVEAVCGLESDLNSDVVAGLASLVDKHMLQDKDPDGEARFVMLETLHEHARDRLEASGAAEQLRRRHAEYFVTLAEAAEVELVGEDGTDWLARLEQEHANVRAALEWSITAEAGATLAMRLAGAIWRFWENHANFSEARRWFERILAARPAASPAIRAKVLTGAGTMAWQQGDLDRAREWHAEALELYREVGDAPGIAFALTNLGVQAYRQGDYGTAHMLFEESLARARAAGDKHVMCYASLNLGLLGRARGEYGPAVAYYTETLALARALENRHYLRTVLVNLAEVEHDQGNYAAAIDLYTEGLVLSREVGNTSEIAYTLSKLGEVAYLQNDLIRATRLLAEASRLLQDVGDTTNSAEAFRIMGAVALTQGDIGRATTLFRDSLALCTKAADKRGSAECLESFALLAGTQGQFARSARLWAAAETVRNAIGAPVLPCNRARDTRSIASARGALGRAAFATAWSAGTALSLEQAIEYAHNSASVLT